MKRAKACGILGMTLLMGLLLAACGGGDETSISLGNGQGAEALVGHWRNTVIQFEEPKDTHLLLKADGTYSYAVVTTSGRSDEETGRWGVKGAVLSMQADTGGGGSSPFTFHEGQLVFPNIEGQRGFWEKID